MATLTSSAALLALLEEPDQSLQVYALENLNELVDEFWTEITDSVTLMYVMVFAIVRRGVLLMMDGITNLQ